MWLSVVNRNTEAVAPGEPNGTVAGYSQGLAVKTGLQLPSASASANMANQFGKNYLLTLPQRTTAGGCIWSSPVQFLVNSRDVCSVELTSDLCSAGSQLDASMYAPSASWGVATGPLVLSSQGVGSLTRTEVHFMCIEEPRSSEISVASYTESCFSTNRTCGVVGDCGFHRVTSAYVCPNSPVRWSTVESQATRCSFDNGFTVPPTPTFDAATGVCRHAVVGVEYNFTWSGQTITRLKATITLADISATGISTATNSAKPTVLSQRFVVTFAGSTNQTAVHNSSSDTNNMVSPSSGNPGKSVFVFQLS